MRAVIQRVARARVTVNDVTTGAIEGGLLVLLGVHRTDGPDAAQWIAEKTVALRIFNDTGEKMNRSVRDTGGAILAVSQFTLYGDARRGNRPGFTDAASGEAARRLYELTVDHWRRLLGPARVATGVFAAAMRVDLVNDGPVTLILDSPAPGT